MSDEVKTIEPVQEVKKLDMTQEELNNLIVSTKNDTKRKATEKLMAELGIEDIAAAKEKLARIKEVEDAQKTEAEKLKALLDEKDKELATIKTQAEISEAKSNALAKGIDPEKIDKFIKIAQTEDGETIAEKIDKAMASFPEFLKKSVLPNISAKTSDNNMNADEMFLANMKKQMGIK